MSNHIHPSAVIGDGVELGDDNTIGPFSVICGPTVIGDHNWIGPFVTIGTHAECRTVPPPVGWGNDRAQVRGVRIGQGNVVREYVSVQQGTHRETTIGNHCYLMRGSYLAHDVLVDDKVTLSAGTLLAGHVHVWTLANIGMYAMVHQHGRVGPGAMVGMGAAVRWEAEAFTVTIGVPARALRMNVVGLTRLGCDTLAIAAIDSYLAGTGKLPSGLPEEVVTALKHWAERDSPPRNRAGRTSGDGDHRPLGRPARVPRRADLDRFGNDLGG